MSQKANMLAPAYLGRFFGIFGVGVAAAALNLCGMATLMAGHGLSRALAWPLATAAVCAAAAFSGALFAFIQKRRGLVCGAAQGAMLALFLLLAQLAADSSPDSKQALGLGLIVLAGAAGGLAQTFLPRKHRV